MDMKRAWSSDSNCDLPLPSCHIQDKFSEVHSFLCAIWLIDWIIWGGEETTCRILGKIKGESKYEHLVHACYSELHPHSSFIWHCCFSDCWIKNFFKKIFLFLCYCSSVTLQFYLLLSSQHFHTFQAASVTSKEWLNHPYWPHSISSLQWGAKVLTRVWQAGRRMLLKLMKVLSKAMLLIILPKHNL